MALLCLAAWLLGACQSIPPPGPGSRAPQPSAGQNGPAAFPRYSKKTQELFDESRLHRVEITIVEDQYLRLRREQGQRLPELPWHLAERVVIDGESLKQVGLRGRGNSFNAQNKRSFKLKFDCTSGMANDQSGRSTEFKLPENAQRKFRGMESLNLRISNNDPTGVRELLAYRLFREAGVPAPRAAPALLVINGQPQGLYLLVEEVDAAFLKNWFASSKGGLYHCAWDGRDGATFRAGSFNPQRYVAQTKATPREGQEIIPLTEALRDAGSGPALAALFDKQNLLKYNAIAALVGHWDSLNGNKANDFVYRDPGTGRWQVIVWDCDNSFGSDWVPQLDCRYADHALLSQASQPCILAARFWAEEARAESRALVAALRARGSLEPEIKALRDLVQTIAETQDPLLESLDAWRAAWTTRPELPASRGAEISQYREGVGLLEYIKQRLAFLENRLG